MNLLMLCLLKISNCLNCVVGEVAVSEDEEDRGRFGLLTCLKVQVKWVVEV